MEKALMKIYSKQQTYIDKRQEFFVKKFEENRDLIHRAVIVQDAVPHCENDRPPMRMIIRSDADQPPG